jgi:hypothetical protein
LKDDYDSEQEFVFDASTVSILQTIFFNSEQPVLATTARVKFMISRQDEKDLLKLGYSQEVIEKLKPQEAMDIIQAGLKATAT